MIVTVRVNGKTMYRVVSKKKRRNMGTYSSRGLAEKRLEQVEYFKRLAQRRKSK